MAEVTLRLSEQKCLQMIQEHLANQVVVTLKMPVAYGKMCITGKLISEKFAKVIVVVETCVELYRIKNTMTDFCPEHNLEKTEGEKWILPCLRVRLEGYVHLEPDLLVLVEPQKEVSFPTPKTLILRQSSEYWVDEERISLSVLIDHTSYDKSKISFQRHRGDLCEYIVTLMYDDEPAGVKIPEHESQLFFSRQTKRKISIFPKGSAHWSFLELLDNESTGVKISEHESQLFFSHRTKRKISIFPKDSACRSFLELLDYIKEQVPKSLEQVVVRDIYHRHPKNEESPIVINAKHDRIKEGLSLRGFDNGSYLVWEIRGV